MSAYVLIIVWSLGGVGVSQQEYANMESCQNAGAIVKRMSSTVRWACVPKDNRTN